MSPYIESKTVDCKVLSNCLLSDHFPIAICVDANFELHEKESYVGTVQHCITAKQWKNRIVQSKYTYHVEQLINKLQDRQFCMVRGCKNSEHQREIKDIYSEYLKALQKASKKVAMSNAYGTKYKTVPGWNDYVKDSYDSYKTSYHNWLSNGKSNVGMLYAEMCEQRKNFKRQLKQCRKKTEQITLGALAADIADADFQSFWVRVKNVGKTTEKHTTLLDGIEGCKNVTALWADIYEQQFSLGDLSVQEDMKYLNNAFESQSYNCPFFTVADLIAAVGKLRLG